MVAEVDKQTINSWPRNAAYSIERAGERERARYVRSCLPFETKKRCKILGSKIGSRRTFFEAFQLLRQCTHVENYATHF